MAIADAIKEPDCPSGWPCFFVPAGSQLMDAAVAWLLVVLSTLEHSVENTGSQFRARVGPS